MPARWHLPRNARKSIESIWKKEDVDSHIRQHGHFLGGLIEGLHHDHHDVQHLKAAALKKQYSSWQILLGLPELRSPALYRSTYVEGMASCFFCWAHLAIVNAAFPGGVPNALFSSPIIYVGLAHAVMAVLIMFACGPASGGQALPTFTLATMFTGHTSVIRGMLYIASQVIGALIGATAWRSANGWDNATPASMALCSVPDGVSNRSALIGEFFTVWFVLMIAYGIALDPKSQAVFGPLLAPIMLGCLIFTVFTSAGGLAAQPNLAFTLCLAPAIVMDGPYDRAIWISFVGPVISCALHAVSFIIVPPHHAEDGCFVAPLLAGANHVNEMPNGDGNTTSTRGSSTSFTTSMALEQANATGEPSQETDERKYSGNV